MNTEEIAIHNKVWIYQAERFLTAEEAAFVNKTCAEFAAVWSSHGTPLDVNIEILHNLFVVVIVDETHVKASGCSIDKLMQLIKAIENYTGISFTNRHKIAYKQNDEIFVTELNKLNQLYAQGIINNHTLIFDNLVHDINSFKQHFLKPLHQSWHSRFLEKNTAVL